MADQIDDVLLKEGGHADLHDGHGEVYHVGIEFIFRALELQFPVDTEAMMLRSGIEFFGFTPRKGEQLPSLFLRFDTMLDRANDLAELAISYPCSVRGCYCRSSECQRSSGVST